MDIKNLASKGGEFILKHYSKLYIEEEKQIESIDFFCDMLAHISYRLNWNLEKREDDYFVDKAKNIDLTFIKTLNERLYEKILEFKGIDFKNISPFLDEDLPVLEHKNVNNVLALAAKLIESLKLFYKCAYLPISERINTNNEYQSCVKFLLPFEIKQFEEIDEITRKIKPDNYKIQAFAFFLIVLFCFPFGLIKIWSLLS